MGKEREAMHSIYSFLVEDWLKMLLNKPIKKEEVDLNREEPKEKKVEERGEKVRMKMQVRVVAKKMKRKSQT